MNVKTGENSRVKGAKDYPIRGLSVMTTINLFRIGSAYCFKHYFERRDLFEELRSYYDSFEYRFKVKGEDLVEVEEKLRSHGFDVNVVEEDEIPDYAVIINKYEKHGDLLKKAVDTVELGDEKALVMKDMASKEEALSQGREPDDDWRARL